MKTLTFAVAILFATAVHAQQDNFDPFMFITNHIIHALPMEASGELVKFLPTLKDTSFSNEINRRVSSIVRERNISLRTTNRGNMIDYVLNSPFVSITYRIYLIPQEGSGVSEIQYSYKGKVLTTDKWMNPQTVLSHFDDSVSFELHSLFTIELMRMDMLVPPPLSARVSYNLLKPEYEQFFKAKAGIGFGNKYTTMVYEDEKGNVAIMNGTRSYLIKFQDMPYSPFKVVPNFLVVLRK